MRECYACGTTISIQNYNGKDYQHWSNNKPTGLFLCEPCYQRIIYRPTDLVRKRNRILFNHKRIQLEYNPRTGVCQLCHRETYTNIHHWKYGKGVLDHTTEVCVSCHSKIGHKLGQLIPINKASLFSVS